MDNKTYMSIRIPKELHDKFQHVADYEGRSMSRQIIYLLNQCVLGFEREHGAIDLPGDGK